MCLGIKEEGDRTAAAASMPLMMQACLRSIADSAFCFDYADQLEQKVIAKFTRNICGTHTNPALIATVT